MDSTRILAIRHGETDWNVNNRIQGQIDIGLNAQGLWQAQQVAQALADEPLVAIYASDLSRALRTAQHIASHHRLEVQTTPLLRERHYGFLKARLGMKSNKTTLTMPCNGATVTLNGCPKTVVKAW